VFAMTFGLETVALRYFNVFGPNQDPASKYALVIPKFILSALKRETIEIHGDGRQERDFTYIDDVVSANISAMLQPGISGETFNVAGGKPQSIIELVKKIEKNLGYKLELRFAPARAGDVKKTSADILKSRKLLKYSPAVSFDEGLKKTIGWFKNMNGGLQAYLDP
jgi:nucleoside-diphosphate-sugar epimerase